MKTLPSRHLLETCTKVLRDFADQHLIRLARGRITALAPGRLTDHAG
ncbi:hypothetical protein [Streptomyces tauricus]